MFSPTDLQQIRQKNISEKQINWQVEQFKNGVQAINLDRHAGINDGILQITNNKTYLEAFASSECYITKFVPASGAASRMFKDLFQALEDLNSGKTEQEVLKTNKAAKTYLTNIEKFAFYPELVTSIKTANNDLNLKSYLAHLLSDEFLGYGNLPKGMLSFHSYANSVRTPFEEHLAEGALYGRSNDGTVNLHFTVSPEHEAKFRTLFEKVKESYEKSFQVQYKISFSAQSPSTDTMSVTPDNEPFRNDDGSILFRPGGHGALIENLNKIDSDIVFIKNIDNVVPETWVADTVNYKKTLAGILVNLQNKIFIFQKAFDAGKIMTMQEEIISFFKEYLFVDYTEYLDGKSESEVKAFVKAILFKPIRVCGIVKNIGEPGGGPFWVKDTKGQTSLQIVESSQINMDDKAQESIFKNSTHFNPVDLVCALKNYKGEKYDLPQYVDHSTCFISKKSKGGKELKALELPGLWNGAMAKWNTLFVEVPVSTFNPVKTVNDLLREQHQNK